MGAQGRAWDVVRIPFESRPGGRHREKLKILEWPTGSFTSGPPAIVFQISGFLRLHVLLSPDHVPGRLLPRVNQINRSTKIDLTGTHFSHLGKRWAGPTATPRARSYVQYIRIHIDNVNLLEHS